MKKLVYFAALLLTAAFTSCEKEDVGGTATESMAGQWYCTIDAVGDDGNPITVAADGVTPNSGENYFGLENPRTLILTYNTASNSATEMWVDNMGVGNLAADYYDAVATYGYMPTYTIKTKVTVDPVAMTFKSTESANFGDGYQWWSGETLVHEEKAMPVTIDGKILPKAGKQNNGSPADSIVFFVVYKGDPWFPGDGYTKYKVSGVRYSGLAEND
jgi:hypothetical protein